MVAPFQLFNSTKASATIFNNNLLGAGQKVGFGFSWDNEYTPSMANRRPVIRNIMSADPLQIFLLDIRC